MRCARSSAGLAALGLVVGAAARAEPAGLMLTPLGPPVTVFRAATDGCDAGDIPDAAARAFRDADGQVVLVASHWRNRLLRGPTLHAVRPDCRVVLEGGGNPDPAAHDDRLWLAATWTADGRTIQALVHVEYQGHRHPGACTTGRYLDCWTNTIIQAASRDGGRSFAPIGRPPAVIAALPDRHDPAARRHLGFFTPSNIIRRDGAWYALIFTEGAGAQPRGSCLLRNEDIADPAAWRAWDGSGFTVVLRDPYAGPPEPWRRPCAPVGRGGLEWPVGSIVRHRPGGGTIAVMIGRVPIAGALRTAVVASTSRDLLAWSPPQPVLEVATLGAPDCSGARMTAAYPSLLDPEAPDRNFETVGAMAELMLTRINPRAGTGGCSIGMDRDLVRIPVHVAAGSGNGVP